MAYTPEQIITMASGNTAGAVALVQNFGNVSDTLNRYGAQATNDINNFIANNYYLFEQPKPTVLGSQVYSGGQVQTYSGGQLVSSVPNPAMNTTQLAQQLSAQSQTTGTQTFGTNALGQLVTASPEGIVSTYQGGLVSSKTPTQVTIENQLVSSNISLTPQVQEQIALGLQGQTSQALAGVMPSPFSVNTPSGATTISTNLTPQMMAGATGSTMLAQPVTFNMNLTPEESQAVGLIGKQGAWYEKNLTPSEAFTLAGLSSSTGITRGIGGHAERAGLPIVSSFTATPVSTSAGGLLWSTPFGNITSTPQNLGTAVEKQMSIIQDAHNFAIKGQRNLELTSISPALAQFGRTAEGQMLSTEQLKNLQERTGFGQGIGSFNPFTEQGRAFLAFQGSKIFQTQNQLTGDIMFGFGVNPSGATSLKPLDISQRANELYSGLLNSPKALESRVSNISQVPSVLSQSPSISKNMYESSQLLESQALQRQYELGLSGRAPTFGKVFMETVPQTALLVATMGAAPAITRAVSPVAGTIAGQTLQLGAGTFMATTGLFDITDKNIQNKLSSSDIKITLTACFSSSTHAL